MANGSIVNPKHALVFAAVMIAFAIFAAVGLDRLLPFLGQAPEVEEVAQVEENTEADSSTVAQTAEQPVTGGGWADDGYSDDWNAAAIDQASNPSDLLVQSEIGDSDGAGFQDYNPSGSSGDRASGSSGPVITSGAAPGVSQAPPDGQSFGIGGSN